MQPEENIKVTDDLIISYLKEELTDDQIKELIVWIKQDKANKLYFDEFCEIWVTSKAIAENKGNSYMKGFLNFKQKIGASEKKSFRLMFNSSLINIRRFAAIFVIAFSISGFLFYGIGKKQTSIRDLSFNEIIVPLGARAEFTLFDGTKVTLNAGSKLKYNNRYGVEDRIVQLEGEAYFKVAKDKNRPFIVKTSHVNIKALGTEFNVKAYSDERTIETTLVEGSVKIEEQNKSNSSETMILKPNQKLTIYKNEVRTIKESKNTVGKDNKAPAKEPKLNTVQAVVSKNIDVAPVISWKENRWIIEKQDLLQLAIEMERKFDVRIHFDSERLKTFRFTGTLLAEPIEQVLTVMSVSAPIVYKIKGKDVSLSEGANFETVYNSLYHEKK